jgi:PRC-barrel domain
MSEHSREQHTSSHHDQEQREHTDPGVEPSERPAGPDEPSVTGGEPEHTVALRDFTAWQGKTLLDRDGETIGKLEDVYFDIETEEAQFGTVKQGGLLSRRHLTFVPLTGMTVGPDDLQATVSKAQVKDAPNIELEGDELSQADESTLYHYYHLNYTPSATPSGRRLARR